MSRLGNGLVLQDDTEIGGFFASAVISEAWMNL
jgi:hypothetical protein